VTTLASFKDLTPLSYECCWRSPSNIAFVKYWGKIGHQVPANPSVSMTLKNCFTQTKVSFAPADKLSLEVLLDKFAKKIEKYLLSLTELSWISNVSFKVETTNTFPHGTGIASSASGLSAFALCLTDYLFKLAQKNDEKLFFEVASNLSRLASGSASRSVYGGFATWGESNLPESSNEFATPFEVHESFKNLKDSVLIISSNEKIVSSTAGHSLMGEHPFAETRFLQAKKNFQLMISALKEGNIESMGKVLESEALSLHAMMLTSPEAYTLLKPNTLKAIELIWDFRNKTKTPVYFTLDAGPNLHLIYPAHAEVSVKAFITDSLLNLTEKIIHDEMGEGPLRC
jgi:diphosphomevalonate decarboxylase